MSPPPISFLYAPIALIVLFSFNSGRYATDLQGFSTVWYGKALTNPFVLEALRTSLTVGLSLGRARDPVRHHGGARRCSACSGGSRTVFDGLVYVSIMIPGIVIGIATLIALGHPVRRAQPGAGGALAGGAGTPPRLQLGLVSLIAAHTLFTMALAILIVRARLDGMDRSLVEASMDLYAHALRAPSGRSRCRS